MGTQTINKELFMFGKKPWLDEFENPLGERELERATNTWTFKDWEEFQRDYPEELRDCAVLCDKAEDIETTFADDDASLWDFISDDVPMHILNKLPELKATIKGLSDSQYRILRHFYLKGKTDTEIAQIFKKLRPSITMARTRSVKRLTRALEKDKRQRLLGVHITA